MKCYYINFSSYYTTYENLIFIGSICKQMHFMQFSNAKLLLCNSESESEQPGDNADIHDA